MAGSALRLVRGNPGRRMRVATFETRKTRPGENAHSVAVSFGYRYVDTAGGYAGTGRWAGIWFSRFTQAADRSGAGLHIGLSRGELEWIIIREPGANPAPREITRPRATTSTRRNPETKETVWAVVEAARHALNIADAARDSGRPILFRIPVMGHKSLDGLLRGMLRDYDAPPRRNPPARSGRTVTVYPSLISIRARKGDGQEYVHKFATGTPVMGLPDGSVLLPARAGRPLWEYR